MLVRRLRGRNANIVVEVHGEVLFAEGTDLARWKNRFSQRVRAAAAEAAPTNKRPRWGHYGKPLKETMTASTSTRITKGGGRFYIAVGSTAPHAYYVDQGTSAFRAKILPPWQRQSPSLYEHTWAPNPEASPIGRIYVSGQKGQHFFDTALQNGFRSMRLRSAQLPGEGVSGMASALTSFPEGLADFVGNTPADEAFQHSLDEWRDWRDRAWSEGRVFGQGITREHQRRELADVRKTIHRRTGGSMKSWQERKAANAARQQRYRDRHKADKSLAKPKPAKPSIDKKARSLDRAKFLAAMQSKYGASNVDIHSLEYEKGYWVVLVKIGRNFVERRAKAKS